MSAMIVLILLLVAGWLIRQTAPKVLDTKISKLLVIGYVFILLVATAASFFLPFSVNKEQVLSNKQVMEKVNEGDEFINEAYQGNWDSTKEFTKIHSWAKSTEEETLTILTSDDMSTPFVERTSDLVNQIEIIHYVTPSYINGREISEHMQPVEVEFSQDKVTVSPPVRVDYQALEFILDFPFRQFSEEESHYFNDHSTFIGNDVILIRVPEQLEVNGQVSFVNVKK